MIKHGVDKLIFSSTAAIFGNPEYTPIDEAHPKNPINPYGQTKLIFEKILADYDRAYGLKSVCLRYFNAAGNHPDGILGERHDPETHLIPIVIQTAIGIRDEVNVYGTDYDTPDGTCIRDYIHVLDLAEAHWLALNYLLQGGQSDSFNLGNGNGYSVSEVIDSVAKVTNSNLKVTYSNRREGDPAVLVANSEKIKKLSAGHQSIPSFLTLFSMHGFGTLNRQQIDLKTSRNNLNEYYRQTQYNDQYYEQ